MADFLRDLLASPTVTRLGAVTLGLIVVFLVVRVAGRSAVRRVEDAAARYRLRKALQFIGYLAAIVLVLNVFQVRLTGLTVAFGVAGAGVAFALQEVIASAAGWVALTFSRFYSPGDRVQLGGIKGDVIDIGVLRTTLMEVGEWVNGDLYTGRIVRVANSFVFKEPVFNYSGDFPFLWDEIRVPVKYGSDRALARTLLEREVNDLMGDYARSAARSWERLVREYRIENARVEPMVTMVANDNWMDFTVRYVVDYRARRVTKDRLFERVLAAVEQTDGRVTLASATFHLVEWPRLDVRLTDQRTGSSA